MKLKDVNQSHTFGRNSGVKWAVIKVPAYIRQGMPGFMRMSVRCNDYEWSELIPPNMPVEMVVEKIAFADRLIKSLIAKDLI